MFASHKYIIKKNKITVYLLHNLLRLAVLLFVALFVLSFSMLIYLGIAANNLDLTNLALFFLFFCAIMSPFFIASQVKVIIDFRTNVVYKHCLLLKYKLTDLNQIDGVISVRSTDGEWEYYSLVSKSNKFGKGFKISGRYSGKQAKEQIRFQNEVIPLIESRLTPTTREIDDTILNNPRFYKKRGYIYAVKPHCKIYQYVLLVAIVGFWVWTLFFSDYFPDWAWFTILPAAIYIYSISQRRFIDVANNSLIACSLWGVFTKSYPLNNFTGFLIVHGSKSPMAEGTAVYMKFVINGNENQIVLRDFGRKKYVEQFKNETDAILKEALGS